MGLPKHKKGEIVTVHSTRHQYVKEIGKKEPVYTVTNYTWRGIVIDVRYDIDPFNFRTGKHAFPMLIKDYPIYYLVKEGNYHATKVLEEERWDGSFLYPKEPETLIK